MISSPFFATGKDPLETLEKGCVNVERHIRNIVAHYSTPVVVAITRAAETPAAELALIEKICVKVKKKKHFHLFFNFFSKRLEQELASRLTDGIQEAKELNVLLEPCSL